jgi:hypothetical protein
MEGLAVVGFVFGLVALGKVIFNKRTIKKILG